MRKLLVFCLAMAGTQLAWAGNCKAPGADSITDLVVSSPELSALKTAVVRLGLQDFLDSNRTLTVFAPDNDAFDATAKVLLDDDNADAEALLAVLDDATLTAILGYHIAPGERDSAEVLGSSRIRMLSKEFTFPSLDGSVPFLNDSTIEVVDLLACNGIVHIISGSVLVPPSL